MKTLLAQSTLAKALTLLLLTLFAVLPLSFVGGLAEERRASRNHAAEELAASHARPQTLTGPFIVVPYVERWTEEKPGDDKRKPVPVARSKQSVHLVFPETASLDGRLAPQQRRRGIFTVQFYELDGTWAGRFPAFDPASLPRTEKNATVEPLAPLLAFGLSDVRGLQGRPSLTLAGAAAAWQPRIPGLDDAVAGIHAPLPPAAMKAWQERGTIDFRMKFDLLGQERLSVVPLADENRAHLASAWPHPSFVGRFLAVKRQVGESGFDAEWAVSSLASGARAQFVRMKAAQRGQPAEAPDTFGVTLVEPLNVYSLTDRAIKYGLLFVALTLLAAFMFELFHRLRLHPIQYGLVALALCVFFLLLLALSEKIAFGAAYAVGAGASVALLTVYFSAVLRGWRRGLGMGGYVAALYGALYGLLSSEDNALLLGALLLFALLALLMLGTRRVDWYDLPQAQPAR